MTLSQTQSSPIINLPYLYKYGMQLSYGSNSSLIISPGSCRDSNNVIDIEIGGVNVEGNLTPVALLVDFTKNGINGLDVGSFTAAQMYAIYVISDSRYYLPNASIACIATNNPIVPVGYDAIRLIGYWSTDVSRPLLNTGYYSGSGNDLTFIYSAARTIGTNSTTTRVSFTLAYLAPPVPTCLVKLYVNVIGNAPDLQGSVTTDFSVGVVYVLRTFVANISTYGFAELVCPEDPITGYPFFQMSCGAAATSISANIVGFEVSV